MIRLLWAAPATAVGLAVVALTARRSRCHVVDGVIEAHGPAIGWALRHLTPVPGGAVALTLGHVVLGRDASALQEFRAHERVHVRQYEVWGPAFLPAYLIASLWAMARGRHFYLDNAFERQAFRSAVVPHPRTAQKSAASGGNVPSTRSNA